jgi:hypothetical protein
VGSNSSGGYVYTIVENATGDHLKDGLTPKEVESFVTAHQADLEDGPG